MNAYQPSSEGLHYAERFRASGSLETTWRYYCDEDREWLKPMDAYGELFPRMRSELQAALDAVNDEDGAA